MGEEEASAGIPEWVVTFGDMMSLLLTFFVMLLSFSEMKQEEKFQAMVDSFHQQFGFSTSDASLAPGRSRPRSAKMARAMAMGRARRFDTHQGGDKVNATAGDYPQVRIIRPGSMTAVGTVITFPEGSTELRKEHRRDLKKYALDVGGKPQKIEIRGHTSLRPLDPKKDGHDNWELAYLRCHNVMKYLTEQGIDPKRIRLAVAGPNEPIHVGTDTAQLKRNPRVEVHMLDEVVEDLVGTPGEPSPRFVTPEKEKPIP